MASKSEKYNIQDIQDSNIIKLNFSPLSKWERFIKSVFDYTASTIAIILLSPLIIFISILIKSTSRGPILFKQERIGLNEKPFYIYKFRSMKKDAGKKDLSLSKINDKRITPIGKILRKYRLDEIPNFINVLKGDLSIVGPRPETKYYIDQIVKTAPLYKELQKVKPGITSLGMVKFGYASNTQEMIERMKYDLFYLNNLSLILDFKILLYTFGTLIKGEGK